MNRPAKRWLSLVSLLAAGCLFVEPSAPPPVATTCDPNSAFTIDSNASLSYRPGIDAGYYIAYQSPSGHWHLEWTCDTEVSSAGCHFTGTIEVEAPANVSCFQCEPGDSAGVTQQQDGAYGYAINFETFTTTGVAGVDFDNAPGHTIRLNLFVDGVPHPELVFFPSGGYAATPPCEPFQITPSIP